MGNIVLVTPLWSRFLGGYWKLFVTSPEGACLSADRAEPLVAPGSMRWPIGQKEPGVIGCQPLSRDVAVNKFGDQMSSTSI